MTEFTEFQKKWMEKNLRCPFCGSDQMSEGPSGGASQNLYCCGVWRASDGYDHPCNARFNSTPFGMDLIQDSDVPGEQYACGIHVTGKQKRGTTTVHGPEGWESVPATGRYTPAQIVRKFTEPKKKHWWRR